MRLIDADALMERMREQAGCRDCNSYAGVRCRACTWEDAINLVDEAPTIDTKKAYFGYWVEEKNRERHWHCSRCETVYGISCVTMNYCPRCGAEMAEHPWAASGCGQTFSPD